jgi:putative ABC transport system permease protein
MLLRTLAREARVAARQCRGRPAFAAAVVSTLALAIGANVAVFSVVDAVLLRALPFSSSARLVWIASVRPDNPAAPFSLPEFADYREQARSLAGLAAFGNWSASLVGDSSTERLQGARMSANSFDVLGLAPVAGRLLHDSDDRPDAPQVVVLSHRLWQRRFDGAASAVGKSVRINGESFTVVGVLPQQFPWPLRDVDVVTPLVPDRDPFRHARSSVNFLRLFGRLKPGVTAAQAQQELLTICRSLRRQFPADYVRKEGVRVTPLQDALVGDQRQPLLLLLGAVAIVLAAALGNLVALMLVRAEERRFELGVRVALGASRLQLARHLAAEAMLLTLGGTALGCALGAGATRLALRSAPASIPRLGEVSLDGRVFSFGTALSAVVTLVLCLAPVLAGLARPGGNVLRLSTRTAAGDRRGESVRRALVIGEMAAALVLLLGTSVLVSSLIRLERLAPGFDPDGVFQARVSLPASYLTRDEIVRFQERLSDRLTRLPGVRQLGVISAAPLSGLLSAVPFDVPGRAARSEHDSPIANLRDITPGYLEAARTRLVAGRAFTEGDRSGTPAVALVSAALAERFLAGAALGKQLLLDDNNEGPRPVEVVGVVENVRLTALDAPPGLDVYLPLRQAHPDGASFLRNNQFWMVRTGTDPAGFATSFAAELRAVDPDAGLSSSGPMRAYVDVSLGPRRFLLWLLAAFSLTAVVLAVTGLYGLVSYTVGRSRREIGVRMALGATERDVLGSVLRQAACLGLAGAGLGLVLVIATRPLWSRLAGAEALDPASAVLLAALLVGVASAAAWPPARRASRIQPTLALKGE